MNPRNPAPHRELGALLIAEKRLAEAKPHFEAAVRSDQWNPDVLTEYGSLLANLGEWEEARPYLRRALSIRPDFAQARANLNVVEQFVRPKQENPAPAPRS